MINLKRARTYIVTGLVLMIFATISGIAAESPKREFRGAWMHTVFQDQYLKQSTAANKKYICEQLDKLKAAGINAVFFQVRPQSDAFYKSDIEPWSRFLTSDGLAPQPFWDPLEFITAEAHKRGMELHAWLNPYRVTSSAKQVPHKKHLYHSQPSRFVTYDKKIYFDPGIPDNQEYINRIVADIVTRYDIDGVHMDDYFYPYPVAGKPFPDSKSYARYGKGKKLDDWRRDNVNRLIESLNATIKSIKPWVRFGVSPFGIWRNKKSDPRGSDTDGLANYDDLYADVLLWAEKGWVDYLIPQLYWNTDHPKASYAVLADWWNSNCTNRHVYIGQSIPVTMGKPDAVQSADNTQLTLKIDHTRRAANIYGNCWWPAYSLTANHVGIADSLHCRHQAVHALPPVCEWLSTGEPEPVYNLHLKGNRLVWESDEVTGTNRDAIRFVVYRFTDENDFNLDDPANIVTVTPDHTFTADKPGYYVVTALDRVNNESLPSEAIHKH